jgi:outer membrane lipoprotein-sorting protein
MKKLMTMMAALAVVPAVAAARTATPPDAAAILTYVDTRVFSDNMTYRIHMTSYKNGRPAHQYGMDVSKRGEMLRIDFTDPSVERGRRILNDGQDLWMYLSRTSRTIRLANRQSFMGTDASNQDLLRVSLRRDYTVDGAAQEQAVNGENLVLIRLKAKDASQAYDRINLYVTAQGHVPRYEEFVTLSGRAMKKITFEQVTNVGGNPFPARVTIENLLVRGSQTVLEYDRVVRDASLQPAMFTLAALRR